VGYVLCVSLVCTILVSLNINTRLDIDEDDDEDSNIPHTPMPRRGSFVCFGAHVAPEYSSIPLQSGTNTRTSNLPSVKIISQKNLKHGLVPNTTEEKAAKPAQSMHIEVSRAPGLTGSGSDTWWSSADQASDSLIPIPTSSISVSLINETATVVDNKNEKGNPELTRQDFPSSLIKPERCVRPRNQSQIKPRSISL